MFFYLDLSIHVCLSVHATWSYFTTRWVASDSPEPAYLDPGAWAKVDPSAEDRAYLAEQANQL